ncbi:hypothetical protein CEXT_637711 [Caerostris extrusa]|uniref:Uncharacterized protein n=1 Tax=Caerostris extrusa TaxID=172846 RepID=A0AAV4MHC5_CAEEX|nr:hypothetical protein CEXT_637711 [Caerostris extrusa]
MISTPTTEVDFTSPQIFRESLSNAVPLPILRPNMPRKIQSGTSYIVGCGHWVSLFWQLAKESYAHFIYYFSREYFVPNRIPFRIQP